MSTNERAMRGRIRGGKDIEGLERCQRSIDRLYAAGCLTSLEYGRLDVLIMSRIAESEVRDA